jgi:2-keto-4-pentenoate hydratase
MAELAERLWQARKRGTVVDLADCRKPESMGEAYAVQAQIARLSGYEVRGFKVGSTSKEAQRILGTTEPGSGLILDPFFYESPAQFAMVPLQMPAVEGEFAFRLSSDLPSRKAAYTSKDVAEAIDAVAGAIEIVGSRLAGGLTGKGRLLVTADGGANIALITGAWHHDWRSLDLKLYKVSMRINGEERGSGEGSRALGDPLNVMVWLANQQSMFGRGLKAGDVVSTGTCTGLDAIASGDHVLADFGLMGKVELSVR